MSLSQNRTEHVSHALQKAGSLGLLAQDFNTERNLYCCSAVFGLRISEQHCQCNREMNFQNRKVRTD